MPRDPISEVEQIEKYISIFKSNNTNLDVKNGDVIYELLEDYTEFDQ